MYQTVVVFSIALFLYSILAGKLEKTVFNGALVYITLGLFIGPALLGLFNIPISAKVLTTLAELTLALVLFADAAHADFATLKTSFRIHRRMLLLGLPLVILLGFAVGIPLFRSLSLLEIAVLATMLAATDAALGRAVVTDPRVSAPIREGLNIESGLNDGICVPVLLLFLAMIPGADGGHGSGETSALLLFAEEIGIGAAIGLGSSLVGGWLLRFCGRKGWITETWLQAPVIALALICFTGAQLAGGSGFIAAFVGGLLFGNMAKKHKHKLLVAAENTGDVLAMVTWIVFGAVVVPSVFRSLTWESLVYAILSLTVVRILPIFLSLTGLPLKTGEKIFLGWFGPRGLASIVFAVIVLNRKLPGGETITTTVVLTIVLSVIAHGLTARPLASYLSRNSESTQKN